MGGLSPNSGMSFSSGLWRTVQGLWSGASGLITGFGGAASPSLALNFATGSLDARITFTRASSATRVNSSGLIETVSTDVARFDYNPATLAAKGLLIEEARTNNATYGSSIGTAPWGGTGAVAALNNATSPDGTTTATRYTSTGGAEATVFNLAAAAGGATSVYFKKGTADWVWISYFDTAHRRCYVNATTGAAGTVAAGITLTIQDAGGGWFRIIAVGAATLTYSTFGLCDADNSPAITAGKTAYFWGAQVEVGAFATSYIPTTSATVTRAADVAVMTGTNFSDWYSQAEGSFIATATSPASGTRAIISADNNTANETVKLYTSTADPKMLVTDGGATQADIDAGSITALTSFKLGGGYKINDFAVSVNGGAEVTDVSGTIPTPDRLRIGTDQAGNYLNGTILTLDYYNTRVALQSLTA